MKNLLFCLSFNGTNYHGWQVQKNAITIQQRVQDAIEKLFGKRLDIHGCSRTDSGVHANHYYFHMHTDTQLPCNQIQRALNHYLPNDIVITGITSVPLDFHARYCAAEKEYLYKIWTAPYAHPFMQNLIWHYSYPLCLKTMKAAIPFFLGTHNFTSFTTYSCDISDKQRTITHMDISSKGFETDIKIRANGFLYHMVRIIVGTFIFISEGKIQYDEIPKIFEAKNRNLAGKTAPSCGLYLNHVIYR